MPLAGEFVDVDEDLVPALQDDHDRVEVEPEVGQRTAFGELLLATIVDVPRHRVGVLPGLNSVLFFGRERLQEKRYGPRPGGCVREPRR